MAFQLTTGSVQWADSELGEITLDFDEAAFTVTQSNGHAILIRAIGYISFELRGLWSDMLIADAEVLDDDPLISEMVQFASSQPELDSGNPSRNRRSYRLLRLRLDSGGIFHCVAAEFLAQPAGPYS